jgi:uncharacterized membrane protein YeiH
MKFQYILELFGTGFFAVSGVLVANRKSNHDWFGVSFIGFITAIGGGSLRDIMLGSYPLLWIKDINFMYAIMVGVLLTRLFYNQLLKLPKALFVFDAIGIAMFTILGVEKTLGLGFNPVIAAIMGMFSAVMGGVIRDVLTNEIPVLFRKNIYASACLAGAILYLILDFLNCERNINIATSTLLVFGIRVVAVKFNITLPQFKAQQ